MEIEAFKTLDLDNKIDSIKQIKNDIIGSFKQKNKYWKDGLIELLLGSMDELEMSSDLLIGAYSIFVCYTHNFEEAYETFLYKEDFSDRIVDNLTKAIELNEDSRIIDLCMQILRNLLVNEMISTKKAIDLGIIRILERLVDNNKRINLVAQIVAKLAKNSDEIKNILMEEHSIIDSIVNWIEIKGSNSFRLSLLDWLISLSSNHDQITSYVRDNINIQKLISLIKYQHNEINSKVAHLATILNSEKKISGDFENLVKQIIFQIARMLQSSELDQIVEATTMLLNLVKSQDLESEFYAQTNLKSVENDKSMPRAAKSVVNKSLWVHTWEIGAGEILSKILEKYSEEYLETMRNIPKLKEERKETKPDSQEQKQTNNTSVCVIDKEAAVSDVTGNFIKIRTLIVNILNITKFLMNASQNCTKKIIHVNMPHHLFKLLDKTVGDEIRICAWEWLRILARAKKTLKIQIIEEDQDLEKQFGYLINDPNIEIQKLGLAIICNFSIDFPGMILTFKEFMPKMNEFIVQDKHLELRLFAIKTIKNLLFPGHPEEVYKRAEKLIFDSIAVKEIFRLLDDSDSQVKEQAELIFRYLNQAVRKERESEDNKPKSILESIDDDSMKARIESLNQSD